MLETTARPRHRREDSGRAQCHCWLGVLQGIIPYDVYSTKVSPRPPCHCWLCIINRSIYDSSNTDKIAGLLHMLVLSMLVLGIAYSDIFQARFGAGRIHSHHQTERCAYPFPIFMLVVGESIPQPALGDLLEAASQQTETIRHCIMIIYLVATHARELPLASPPNARESNGAEPRSLEGDVQHDAKLEINWVEPSFEPCLFDVETGLWALGWPWR